ncbi:hypothetical protein K1719_045976 [Acacia pycnantha]|nr:hypothetical protein K1719_045976 [Acacia pycnantha]
MKPSVMLLVFKTTTSQAEVQVRDLFSSERCGSGIFQPFMDESDRPLYQGCQKYSKLSFLIKLYHIKCMCGITDKAMSMFLELLRDAFPDADIPSSFYEAKKIINEIRLELPKIDALCKRLYALLGRGRSEETCKKCHTSRFKTVRKGKKRRRNLRRF